MLMFVIGIFFLSLIVKVVLALALVEAIVTSYVPAVTLSVRVIFMPVVARVGVMMMTYKTETPRAQGMGNLFIGKGTMGMIITAIVYSSALIIVLAKFIFAQPNIMILKILSSIIFIIVFALLFKRHVYKKIDGITGDILGCTIELGEVFYLIYAYILISLI